MAVIIFIIGKKNEGFLLKEGKALLYVSLFWYNR